MINKIQLTRIITITALYIVAIVLHYTIDIIWWADLSIFVALYLMAGYDILWGAIRHIVKGNVFDENFLMSIATIGAFVIGEYVDAVAVMILFQIGELFQHYAVNKSRRSIASLMDICPQTANVVRDAQTVEVDPQDVQIGDILLVRAGEKVPLDGVIISGESYIDTSALTGESALQAVKQGDNILSGSINTQAVLQIKVTQLYTDSTVMRILQLVEEAADNKSTAENFITKFSRYYTPIVVVLALLLAVVPSLFDGQWAIWAKRAMMFLFVSCPCALAISVPMTFFGGIGCASKHGILVKGGNYLQKLARTNTFVMDKTGTLTQGKFAIKQIVPSQNTQEILQCAYIAESQSTHPIARSIVDSCSETIDTNGYDTTELRGLGIVATNKLSNTTIVCGNKELLANYNIQIEDINQDDQIGCTVVYVAKNNQYLGKIFVADNLKTDSIDAVKTLQKQGAEVIMLTGDNRTTACQIANQAGIDKYYYELLPNQKVDKLVQIMNDTDDKHTVAFVGDGINDAPALMRADIGIAMGAIGSDAAIEAADVVLVNDNLSAIPLAKQIASKTVKIAVQNIVFALTIKIAILILSSIGIVDNLIIAILADVGVSILAILNALRAMRIKAITKYCHNKTLLSLNKPTTK